MEISDCSKEGAGKRLASRASGSHRVKPARGETIAYEGEATSAGSQVSQSFGVASLVREAQNCRRSLLSPGVETLRKGGPTKRPFLRSEERPITITLLPNSCCVVESRVLTRLSFGTAHRKRPKPQPR